MAIAAIRCMPSNDKSSLETGNVRRHLDTWRENLDLAKGNQGECGEHIKYARRPEALTQCSKHTDRCIFLICLMGLTGYRGIPETDGQRPEFRAP